MKAIHITAYTEDVSQIEAIKAVIKAFKIKYTLSTIKEEKSEYNKEFVAKILSRSKSARKGNVIEIDAKNLWASLGLK